MKTLKMLVDWFTGQDEKIEHQHLVLQRYSRMLRRKIDSGYYDK